MLYEQRVSGRERIQLLSNQELQEMHRRAKDGRYRLKLRDRHAGTTTKLDLDAVILATGFRNFGAGAGNEPFHPLLQKIAPRANFRADGGIDQQRDYSVPACADDVSMPWMFLNGVSESTHGFGDAGSFSLLSLRSDLIADRILAALRSQRRLPACGGPEGRSAVV